jgi:LmbE family N-acetylglucosaminyl deacetylase
MKLPFVRKVSPSQEMTSSRTELDGVDKVEDVVILSPHCDDAPLSLGATLLSGFLRSKARVFVVFSRSRCTKDYPCNGPIEEITTLRNREEELAATQASYEVSFLGFGEPFVREGFLTIKDIYDLRRQPRQDEVWKPLLSAFRQVFSSRIQLILAPLACGGHVDHRIVHQAVLECSTIHTDQRIGFYEDLPYSSELSDSAIIERVPSSLSRPLHPVLVTESIDDKLELLKVYESQLVPEQFKQVRRYWERRKGERIWLP